MSSPIPQQRGGLKYQKEEQVDLNSDLFLLLCFSNGGLKEVEFELRFKKDLAEEYLHKVNTYEDPEKY